MIRDSYRQSLLLQASKRRQDCQGKTHSIRVELTRDYYFSLRQPLHQTLLRQILTGAIDHRSRLFKSNLTDNPLCLFCNNIAETAKHIFWDCPQWSIIRAQYPTLLRLYTLVGAQWPSCFLNCGWLERERNYGFFLLNDDTPYEYSTFIHETHNCTYRFYSPDMKLLRHLFLHPLLHLIYTYPKLFRPLHPILPAVYSSKEMSHPFQSALRSQVKTTFQ